MKRINKARDALIKKYPKPEVVVGGILPVIEEYIEDDAPKKNLPIPKEDKEYDFEVTFKDRLIDC